MILRKPKIYKVFKIPDKYMRLMDLVVGIICGVSIILAYPSTFWMAFWAFFATLSFVLFFTNGTARFQRWLTAKAKMWMLAQSLKLPKK